MSMRWREAVWARPVRGLAPMRQRSPGKRSRHAWWPATAQEPGGWSRGRLGGGLDPAGVVTTLLSPALRSIGDRWASGELTVADEHRATAVAQRIIGRLGLQFGRPGRSRGTVVLAAPAGDLHTLPVAMVADLLRWRRFDVIELGANTPADALAHAVSGSERLVAVGIAATISGHDAQVSQSVEAVRLVTSAPIIVGGSAIQMRVPRGQVGGRSVERDRRGKPCSKSSRRSWTSGT